MTVGDKVSPTARIPFDWRFAAIKGLGKLKRYFLPNQLRPLLVGLAAILVVLLALRPREIWQIGALVLLPGLVWGIWNARAEAAALFEYGFAYYNGRHVMQANWRAISHVEESSGI